jgi:hypothetical protein
MGQEDDPRNDVQDVLARRAAASRLRAGTPMGEDTSPAVAELVRLFGVDGTAVDPIARELAYVLETGAVYGLSPDSVGAIVQAYARAVGRIAAAEADVLHRAVCQLPDQDRAIALERMLGLLFSVGSRGFSLLHEVMLHDDLEEIFADDEHPASPLTGVAHVDLVGSTAHLAASDPDELDELVDALFEAGQHATTGTSARAVKYVGDGVFIAGGDVADVARAALGTIERLEHKLPLRARAGLAHGRVLRRAGDIFGLPVNNSQLLCKRAEPGTVLADRAAADLLPEAMRGTPGQTELHPALPITDVVEVRPE